MGGQTQRHPALTLLILVLPLASFFLMLGATPLFDVDEGAFSEATREMFERGDFLSTYLNGEHRFDKPILIYWLQALPFMAFRPLNGFSACPRRWRRRSGATRRRHFARERFAPTPLSRRSPWRRRPSVRWRSAAQRRPTRCSTCCRPRPVRRLAALKRIVGAPAAQLCMDRARRADQGSDRLIARHRHLLYCASRLEWRRWLRSVFDPLGWLILAVLVVPWYAAALSIHGQAFIDGFILKHNVKRFTGSLEGHSGSLFYYVVAVPLLLLPWTTPLFSALRHVRDDASTAVRRFLWLWAGFVVVFFSLSGTKLPHYVLYGATPLFLLVAAHRDALRQRWLHLLPPTLLLAAFVALPLVTQLLSQGSAGNAYYRAQLAEAKSITTPIYYVVTIGALLVWLGVATKLKSSIWSRLSIGAMICMAVLTSAVSPWAGTLLQGPVKEAALAARALGGTVVAWRFDAPSISVSRRMPQRPPEPGNWRSRIDRR